MSTGELLALDLDLIDEAKSYGHTLLQPPWSPTSPRSPRDELETILPTLIPMLLALPRRLDRIGDAVERNEISIGVHLFPDERDRPDRLASRPALLKLPTSSPDRGTDCCVHLHCGFQHRTRMSTSPAAVVRAGQRSSRILVGRQARPSSVLQPRLSW